MERASVLLDKAWKIYRPRFWELTLVMLIPAAIMTTSATLNAIVLASTQNLVVSSLILFAVSLLTVLLGIIINLGVMYSIAENLPIRKTLVKACGGILAYGWIMFLSALITLGGFLFLVVPGIIFSLWFIMAAYVFVAEKQKGLNALLRSREYVRGHGLAVAWRWFFFFIISLGLTLAASLGGSLLTSVLNSFGLDLRLLVEAATAFLTAVIMILGLHYNWVLFEALRQQKPDLRDKPVAARKGWWAAAALWGLLGPLGTLSVITIATLNPNELLLQARDAQRMSDLPTLQTALAFYAVAVAPADFSFCVPGKVFSSDKGTTAIDGTGWLPIDFDKISGGSPIGKLPSDPINRGQYVYKFACDARNPDFELNGVLESGKHKLKMAEDKGNNDNVYEIGTVPGLNLIP